MILKVEYYGGVWFVVFIFLHCFFFVMISLHCFFFWSSRDILKKDKNSNITQRGNILALHFFLVMNILALLSKVYSYLGF